MGLQSAGRRGRCLRFPLDRPSRKQEEARGTRHDNRRAATRLARVYAIAHGLGTGAGVMPVVLVVRIVLSGLVHWAHGYAISPGFEPG